MGRSKGGSAKQAKFKALVGEGVAPLEAARQAGYSYPGRELKRQAAQVAEARGADPLGVLTDVLRYGSTADKISAAAAILQTEEASEDADSGARYVVLTDCAPAGVTFHDTVDDAVDAVLRAAPMTQSTSASPHRLARATLNAILSERITTNAQLVAAARALLRDHPEPSKPAERREPVVAVWIDNQNGPAPRAAAYARATC